MQSYDFLCLDERDSPNLAELKNKHINDIRNQSNRRHFGLCGVIISGDKYADVNVYGRTIQEKCFGNGVYNILHYIDILNNRDEFAFLGLNRNKNKRISLISRLKYLLKKSDISIIASFIDKHELALQYGLYKNKALIKIRKIRPNVSISTTPGKINLYEISLKFILKNFHDYLKRNNKKGIIIAEARGEKEDKSLLDSFYYYQKFGAGSLTGKELRSCIIDLLIIRKAQNHIGTQIADLVTYPIYDYHVPDHSIRKDHFITAEDIKERIVAIEIFPNKKGA